jgi:glucokinase
MSYLGIDIGGSKTLIAVFDASGKIVSEQKFPTDHNYDNFLLELEKNVASLSTNTNIACAVAIPGLISRDTGVVHALGNLPWKEKPIKGDISKAIGNLPVIIENDARLGGLAEASAIQDKYRKVLYLTISTGIGGALIENGKIVEALQDMEVGQMPLSYEGKTQTWESFASGKAIDERYGRQASEITGEQQWREIGERIGYGVAVCCSELQPEAVVFGGGAGQFAEKFVGSLGDYLEQNLSPLVKRPKALLGPAYTDHSVIHGCFILLKQRGLIQ